MQEPPERDAPARSQVRHADIEAIVRFFDPDKGYGFVRVPDGSPDAFLSVAAIEQANCADLQAGDVVFCAIEPGPKSPMVSAIHYVDRNPFGRAAGHIPGLDNAPASGAARVKRAGQPAVRGRSGPR